MEKLIFLTNARLLSKRTKLTNWNKLTWDFESLSDFAAPLIGHLIHRELRSFGRYPDFYFYFDQYKALQIWNYWNYMDIVIPFNGVIPKGEIGINPAYPNLKYNTYIGEVENKNEHTFLHPKKQIQLDITPKLVDLKFTFMRSKENYRKK